AEWFRPTAYPSVGLAAARLSPEPPRERELEPTRKPARVGNVIAASFFGHAFMHHVDPPYAAYDDPPSAPDLSAQVEAWADRDERRPHRIRGPHRSLRPMDLGQGRIGATAQIDLEPPVRHVVAGHARARVEPDGEEADAHRVPMDVELLADRHRRPQEKAR